MSIIDNNLPNLEVIKTCMWSTRMGRDSVAEVMAAKTNLKKIIFTELYEIDYSSLITIKSIKSGNLKAIYKNA